MGYALTTVGFGMVVEPTWRALLAHLFLGLVVGLIVQLSRPDLSLAPILPTLSAVVCRRCWPPGSSADVADDGCCGSSIPALIAMLPGMALVIGGIRIAGGRIVSVPAVPCMPWHSSG